MNTAWMSICFLLFQPCFGDTVEDFCVEPQAAAIQPHKLPSLTMSARACQLGDQRYSVTLTIRLNDRVVDTEMMPAEGGAYVLSVDNSLDLDGDGIPEIGVANAMGRAGDGTSYWSISSSAPYLTRLGEAPKLMRKDGNPRTFYASLPGSADLISTTMEYEIVEGRLHPTRALQFAPVDELVVEVRELIKQFDKGGDWVQRRSRRISIDSADQCMEKDDCLR
jgi:hypothetical protein